ncbi:integral membrane protein, partial [Glonium stellatum]
LSNILAIIYVPVMFAAKLAVLLQINRIFAGAQKNFTYWSVRVLITVNVLAYSGIFFARVFACVPREKIWNPAIPGRCISTSGSIIATGGINTISDLTILFLPLYGVWGLQMPRKRKLAVGAVFGTGFFACISSIIRLAYSVRLAQTDDFTWGIYPVDMWAYVKRH